MVQAAIRAKRVQRKRFFKLDNTRHDLRFLHDLHIVVPKLGELDPWNFLHDDVLRADFAFARFRTPRVYFWGWYMQTIPDL